MKAVTRQRPKNANYFVSSNPTKSHGAPLKTKSRSRHAVEQKSPPSKKQSSQPEGSGGRMTKFRNLDDIPDFTDEFGKDKPHAENSWSCDEQQSSSGGITSHLDEVPFSPAQRIAQMSCNVPDSPKLCEPPPLPAEEHRLNSNYGGFKSGPPANMHSPNNRRAPTSYDDSCDSVDTDISDLDDECNNSYFSSTDDYHVDYAPEKRGNNAKKKPPPKYRVIKEADAIQSSYPTKQPSRPNHNINSALPREKKEITYKPYTIEQYRKIKPKDYVEFSKLKPDLNTTELIAKRANAERIKQFSKNLNDFNKMNIKSGTTTVEKEVKQKVKATSKREKALQFAQKIPKPKVSESGTSVTNEKHHMRNVGASIPANSKIDELTSKHQQSKKQVEAIKKSMGL